MEQVDVPGFAVIPDSYWQISGGLGFSVEEGQSLFGVESVFEDFSDSIHGEY